MAYQIKSICIGYFRLTPSTPLRTGNCVSHATSAAFAPQANRRFNADANTGHGFAIFMASVGALRASRSGAG
jgi:hypothetical protein